MGLKFDQESKYVQKINQIAGVLGQPVVGLNLVEFGRPPSIGNDWFGAVVFSIAEPLPQDLFAGDLEHRELTSSTMLNDHLDWPGVKQVCRLRSKTLRQGVWSTEVAYAITSVGRDRADARALLNWWRGHWGIENKAHWVRDETFGEDRSRVRCGSAPWVLAGLRNLVMNWLRAHKIVNLAVALRENGWNPQPLFAMLGKQNQ